MACASDDGCQSQGDCYLHFSVMMLSSLKGARWGQDGTPVGMKSSPRVSQDRTLLHPERASPPNIAFSSSLLSPPISTSSSAICLPRVSNNEIVS